jgi:hypothetical protein
MNNKVKIALVVFAIIVIAVLVIIFTNVTPTVSTTSTISAAMQKKFLVFGNDTQSIYSFNGTLVTASRRSGIFVNINTIANPIAVANSTQSLDPQSNLSSLYINSFKQQYPNVTSIEKVLFVGTPIISKTGLGNNFTLILYSGSRIGNGDDLIEVFTPNSASQWRIYTNGTTYYVANATYNEYVFLYGNDSTILGIIPYGSKLNNSAVPTNSKLFPQSLLPYLNSLRLNSNLSFVSDGTWWYSYFILHRFETQVPAGFAPWG